MEVYLFGKNVALCQLVNIFCGISVISCQHFPTGFFDGILRKPNHPLGPREKGVRLEIGRSQVRSPVESYLRLKLVIW